ncbi:MAG: DUF4851 domain-containing protein [Bilophila sp.]
MKTMRLMSFLLVLALVACTPLRRGFEGSTLVSPAQPPLSVTVDMPLLASGQIAPYLYTDRGYQFPDTLVAVYGTNAASPLALSVLSVTPNNKWTWDPLTFSSPDRPVSSNVAFGGEAFAGSVHRINGAKDPFAPLFAADEGARGKLNWIAQRFACRMQFDQVKIILEYREPLSATLAATLGSSTEIPLYNQEVQAFQARAAKVFAVQFAYTGPTVGQPPYIKSLNSRYLGAFLGSMSVKDLPLESD